MLTTQRDESVGEDSWAESRQSGLDFSGTPQDASETKDAGP